MSVAVSFSLQDQWDHEDWHLVHLDLHGVREREHDGQPTHGGGEVKVSWDPAYS